MILAGLSRRPGYAAYHFLWTAIDWLYPPVCGGCGKSGARFCQQCRAQTQMISPECITYFEDSLINNHLDPTCQKHQPFCDQLHSWGVYEGPLRKAIHALKFQRDLGLADYFSGYLIERLNNLGWKFDLITAIPLSRNRQNHRGFNQAALLARPVALAFDRPFSSEAVIRNRETHSQVGLHTQERYKNVMGAFTARPGLVRGKIILIMDDVTTTGATIQACGKALKEAGAAAVYGLTLARTPFHNPQADDLEGG